MNSTTRLALASFAVLAGCATQEMPPGATTTAASTSLATDLANDVTGVEKKLADLAAIMTEQQFDWRPADGVRTVREVLLHVASDNYLLPAMQGFTPDPATGITTDYQTAVAFEKRALPKDSVIAELRRSFEFLRTSLSETTPSKMGEPVTMFGQSFTGQSSWILTVTHLHEHLGQLIAYARSNGVVPPWS